ncbi:MAG: glycyl-radical enzyme activating protein [Erysipelotrichaceae bacterium]|nr:glycyl-radical enzyme activating protein [Erysipelotrichaceae bacterium]
MEGITFNIQKFSIHDGPGVRTTVFLKGCPLRCKWCANPESQLSKVQILWDSKKCSHCLTCVYNCPESAINEIDGKIILDFNKCVGCLGCMHSCPSHALEHEGEHKSVEEVVAVCLQDKDFYEESGGGVTISGGEGMVQPEFAMAIIDELHKEHIHVAIETTGYVEEEIFHKLASKFDLLLFDVKHYDRDQHFAGTAVDNDLIIKNLSWAISQGIDVLPRIPVIPGFNASLEDAKGIALLLKDVGAKKVQLLPFHQFGERKYELLNRAYAYTGVKALHPEDLKEYQQVFLEEGIDCYF